jgi:hypothetical protein
MLKGLLSVIIYHLSQLAQPEDLPNCRTANLRPSNISWIVAALLPDNASVLLLCELLGGMPDTFL